MICKKKRNVVLCKQFVKHKRVLYQKKKKKLEAQNVE